MELWKPKKVRRRGSIRFFKTPSGNHVIVLPTCSVPVEYLARENWLYYFHEGHVRKVSSVQRLRNSEPITDHEGKEVVLYAKGPERYYANWHEISASVPWNQALDERRVEMTTGDVRVEKQATWEARILLGLLHKGIKAEEPQAIVIHRNGSREVITKGIAGEEPQQGFLKDRHLKERATNAGFVPVDLSSGNVIEDPHGDHHIIDVNRWGWPPFTDIYKKRLIRAIHEEIEKQKPKGNV